MSNLADISRPARIADPDEGISTEELALAARNHGCPLEALRWDITPVGLHYLLIHYDIPSVEPGDFRLVIDGVVDTPLTLDQADLRSRPATTTTVTLECAGNGRARLTPRPVSQPWLEGAVGTARWTGTPLAPLLREAGVGRDAVDVVFTGADHGVERGVEQDYQRSLSVSDALGDEVLLAYAMNGAPLPPQHGYPLRLIVPGWYGMAHVKWLTRITVVDRPFDGFQMRAYAHRLAPKEAGERLTRIEPRALIVPPGFPDFMSRRRVVDAGRVLLEGRAWSGFAPIVGVEVRIDDGSWEPAEVEPGDEPFGWVRWTWPWPARPGSHTVAARARDAGGRVQPDGERWNRGGFANNPPQELVVHVREPAGDGGSSTESGTHGR